MKASDINKRARSLADMPNADFITYEDELGSLNESWKDIYSKLTEQDEDYFIKEHEFEGTDYTLPSDMFKLRTVDIFMGDKWTIVNKVSLSSRNGLRLGYRISGKELIIVGNVNNNKIRITYYPPPEWMTLPDVSITYNTNLPTVNDLYSSWGVIDSSNILNTVNNSCYLIQENEDTPQELFSSAGDISHPLYYKNSILFIEDGEELKKRTSDNTIITLIDTASGGISPNNYRPSIVKDKYYYVPIDESASKVLDLKTGVISVYDDSILYDSLFVNPIGDKRYYLTTDVYGLTSLKCNSTTLVHQGVEAFSYPFFTVDDVIYRLDENDNFTEWGSGSIGANGKTSLIVGDPFRGNIITIGNAQDSNFNYPLNIVPEIMSYSMALDYTRKAQGDPTLIKTRLGELWMRLEEVVKRDDYETEVINSSNGWVYNYGE